MNNLRTATLKLAEKHPKIAAELEALVRQAASKVDVGKSLAWVEGKIMALGRAQIPDEKQVASTAKELKKMADSFKSFWSDKAKEYEADAKEMASQGLPDFAANASEMAVNMRARAAGWDLIAASVSEQYGELITALYKTKKALTR